MIDSKTKLAIFDLDGTLFDTRIVNYKAYREALEIYNYSIDYEYFANYCDGLDYKSFLPAIIGENKEIINAVHDRKKENYNKFLVEARMNEHLFEIIEGIQPKYHIAIVTTASRRNCVELLKSFNKKELFEKIFAQEDVPRKKPDPQGFLMAMEYFSIAPENTIIFEDSKAGIEAAGKTGAAFMKIEKF